MALSWSWRRFINFRRWKKSTTPTLLNAETGELISFSSYTEPPKGKWMLRRPLTLPGSPVPLFLEVRGIPARTKRSDVEPAAPGEQIAPQQSGALPSPGHTMGPSSNHQP
jgi:hypothetical protein